MGTNYYWLPSNSFEECGECGGQKQAKRHIGKSSFGWCFGVHVDDEFPSWEAWKETLSSGDGKIVDEYGREIGYDDMVDLVENRMNYSAGNKPDEYWYSINQATPGPHGLVRHKTDNRHCVGHGNGTWDLIAGEFS